MFGTIRKHQTWLWALIITVIIISFVIFFSPYSKLNSSSGSSSLGKINGQRLTAEDFINARRESELRYFFMSGGNWPGDDSKRMGFDIERETYQWLFLVSKQEQLGIHISSEAVAQAARDMISQFQKAGITSPSMFLQQVLRPHGLDLNDFERYMRHSLGLQELISTVALGGKLVTPQEAKSLYVREHEEVATDAVFFSGSNYMADVTVTPEVISNYYAPNLSRYRIPEQIQVSYVKFGISNHLAMAEEELTKTNLAQIIDDNYQRLGTNHALIRDAKTPEEAKAKIREELIRGRALNEAAKKALEFARPLFDMEPVKAENLQEAAKQKGLTVEVSSPFGPDGPKDLEVGQEFTKKAFTRTPEEPFAGPLMGKDGVYVIAQNKRIPSWVPPLDQVKAQVEADYKMGQGQMRARQAGQSFALALTNGLAQGKTFAAICAETKVTPIELPPFSISTRSLPQAEDYIPLEQLKLLAFKTPAGKASDFQPTSSGGVVLNVKSRLPISEAKLNSELPGFTSYLRQNRQSEAFNDWFRKEADRGMRDTPLFRQQQQQQQQQRPPAARTAKS